MKHWILFAAALLPCSLQAEAATLGANCNSRAEIIVAPTMQQASYCAAAMGCVVGFEANGGYYAIAVSADGRGFSATAGGFRKKESAMERAVARCESYGSGLCAVSVIGRDNGNHYRNCN